MAMQHKHKQTKNKKESFSNFYDGRQSFFFFFYNQIVIWLL